MPKFFVSEEQLKNDTITIKGQDVNHIKNVLRKKENDRITICNSSSEQDYLCEISNIEDDQIICKIMDKIDNNVESNIKVTIFQGLPKADKMELVIQKSVELGVYDITPVEMKRCVVKLDGKDKIKKIERWQKIAEVAAKQSGRDIVPEICSVKNVKEISNDFSKFDLVILCYENEKNIFLKDVLKELAERNLNSVQELKIAVIIGPEGGIDISEVEYMEQNGAKVVSLGNRILRTETVGLSLLSIIMYEFERNEK